MPGNRDGTQAIKVLRRRRNENTAVAAAGFAAGEIIRKSSFAISVFATFRIVSAIAKLLCLTGRAPRLRRRADINKQRRTIGDLGRDFAAVALFFLA